eukprot:CAMPEP_0182898730 /NCGR_PEP_ID=MMETSP0034_2-20130328/27661_1 /TAXON_ID=156128 /ORGANISM="Nephroselmis pyriformis, Strain CCMP717" /LENGTH=47 /DNA_ID= /DNA_START= /DNA_END= /DNA_ORIENTATION=
MMPSTPPRASTPPPHASIASRCSTARCPGRVGPTTIENRQAAPGRTT